MNSGSDAQAGIKAAECTLHQLAEYLASERLVSLDESDIVANTLDRIAQNMGTVQQATIH